MEQTLKRGGPCTQLVPDEPRQAAEIEVRLVGPTGSLLLATQRCREKFRQHDRPRRLEQGLLDDALQLAHITGPGIGPQQLHRLRRDVPYVFFQLPAESSDEILDQKRQVVTPDRKGKRLNPSH